MINKILIVYNSSFLFDILTEIKENLNFEVKAFDKNIMSETYFANLEDHVIVSDHKNDFKHCNKLTLPNKINKIIEQINILFLSKKFFNQSNIEIGKYNLNLNSRQITIDNKSLNLTEKETELILYILNNKFVSLKDLQKNVWKHSSEGIETHTVETHVYRLRKKFSDKFKDDGFIKHDKRGYYLN